MSRFQAAYIPIGVPTFHLESAQIEFEKSIETIKSITENGVYPEKMLLSIDDLTAFLDTIDPDVIILQNITFANSAYASEVMKRFKCPVLLWTLREPVIDGGRLRLNSLTGAYSAGNAMLSFRNGNFEYIFGSPEEENVKRKIKAMVRAAELKVKVGKLKMASVGHTPQGFGFGRALDIDMLNTFGVTLESIEARELIDNAKNYTEEECLSYLEELKTITTGTEEIPEANLIGFARIYKAYKEYLINNNIGAFSSRCWPDFFTAYGTPVCAVLAMLNDMGIAAGCEADTYGALSMYMGMELTKSAVFFGDPVSLDEGESTITFWHCGTAACSLASEKTGAAVGVHPNRKIGPTMEFGCKPAEEVTVFRVGRKPDGTFRLFLLPGEALDKPKQFCGTSVVVKTARPAEDVVNRSVQEGWEPHFAVIYGDVLEELKILGHMLGLEVCIY
ncbi:fucose isomerase [Lacrimispora sp.]|uniref:fucose isomerase n=1 Tax=Lacrimispora sp. TaxID=2719234 RepID=UPI00345FD4A0